MPVPTAAATARPAERPAELGVRVAALGRQPLLQSVEKEPSTLARFRAAATPTLATCASSRSSTVCVARLARGLRGTCASPT